MKELKGVRRSYACFAGWELKAQTDSSRQHITNIIAKVNQRWQKQNPNPGNAFWQHGIIWKQ